MGLIKLTLMIIASFLLAMFLMFMFIPFLKWKWRYYSAYITVKKMYEKTPEGKDKDALLSIMNDFLSLYKAEKLFKDPFGKDWDINDFE